MRIFQEEIFGPVLAVTTFKTTEEALEIANDTMYGLGAGVWTRDAHELYQVPRAIQAGRVWVNQYHAYPAGAPFGGYKQSGIGRENHKMMLSFAADHGYDHLQAMLSNVVGEQPPFLEQSVFSEHISDVDCVAAQALAKAHWQQLNSTLIGYLSDAESKHQADTQATYRLRVGLYVYHEKTHES